MVSKDARRIGELLGAALVHIYTVRVSRELGVERQTDIAHAQDCVEKALKMVKESS